MAGEWIKMRVGLVTNPKVLRIADHLLNDSAYLDWSVFAFSLGGVTFTEDGHESDRRMRYAALRVTRYVAVTSLLRWWSYANENADGEFVAGVLREDVDEIVGVPGFASALEQVGWAIFNATGGVILPNFSEHNTSANARSSGAARQKRYRDRLKKTDSNNAQQSNGNSNATRDVTVTPREEKNREEKKKEKKPSRKRATTTIPENFCVSDRVKTWAAEKKFGRLDEYLEFFRSKAVAKGYVYADWDEGFMGCVREDWPGFRKASGTNGFAAPTPGTPRQRRELGT